MWPEHGCSHGDPDDGVGPIFRGRVEEANRDSRGEEDESPRVGAHHPLAMTGDVAVANQLDGYECAKQPRTSVNPTDGIRDGIGAERACNVHSHGRGDEDGDEIEVSGAAMEGEITAADSTGKLNRGGEERDGSGDAVQIDPTAGGAKVDPCGIGVVVEKESLIVVEHEERANRDCKIKQILGVG